MRPLLLLLLVGCGWSEDKFAVKGIPAWCEAASDCVGFEVGACEDHIRAVDRSSCDYDPAAARRCYANLEDEGTCTPLEALGTASFQGPEDCDLIWDGCGPLFEVPIIEGTSPPAPEE